MKCKEKYSIIVRVVMKLYYGIILKPINILWLLKVKTGLLYKIDLNFFVQGLFYLKK